MINQRVITIYFITAIICASITYFGILPNLSKSLQIIKQINSTQKQLNGIAEEKKILTDLSKNENLEKLLTFATNAIPETTRENELTNELNNLTRNAGVSLNEKINIDNAQASPGKVKFSFSLSGNFSSMIKFFTLSEKSSRLLTFENIDLTKTGNNKLIAQISGTAYWTKIDLKNTDESVSYEVTTNTIKKLQNLTEPEPSIITPAETGFGRLDPFNDIKNNQ